MNQPISISEVPEGALGLGILMNCEGHIQESSTGSVHEKRSHSSASFLTMWWFQTLFSPLFGEMIQFDKQIFQMGGSTTKQLMAVRMISDGFPGEGARELPGKKCCSPLASYCTPSATTDPW